MNQSERPDISTIISYVQFASKEVTNILDARPKLITENLSHGYPTPYDNDSKEAQSAFRDIIINELSKDPFYEFFASIEVVEDNEVNRLGYEYFRGRWYAGEIKDEEKREKVQGKRLPNDILNGLYNILIPFLASIQVDKKDTLIRAEIVQRKNYKAVGVVEYSPMSHAYVYHTY